MTCGGVAGEDETRSRIEGARGRALPAASAGSEEAEVWGCRSRAAEPAWGSAAPS